MRSLSNSLQYDISSPILPVTRSSNSLFPIHKPFTATHNHPQSSSIQRHASSICSSSRLCCTASNASPQQITSKPHNPQQPTIPPETKYPVSLKATPVTPNVLLLRASCTQRLPEIQFGEKRGTTTNNYLIKGPSSSKYEALIDVPSKAYDYNLGAWLQELDALSSLRTIIITRLNPERIPPLKDVLRALPIQEQGQISLYASNPALLLLKERSEADIELAELLTTKVALMTGITRGTEASLGSSTTSSNKLKFIPVPTPRWPDLCAVYSPSERVLFSSSFFAAHVAPQEGSSSFDQGGWELYGPSWSYYYDCMLAPTARQAAIALERLRINATDAGLDMGIFQGLLSPLRGASDFIRSLTLGADDGRPEPLEVSILCPIHGPVVKSSLTELVRRYTEWTAKNVECLNSTSVAVLYASAYGNTAALAQAISRGVLKAGVGVETLNLELVGTEDVEKVLQKSDGFVLGSPTLGGHMPTQVQTALGVVLRAADAGGLPCGVFGSFGWSGEAVDMMEQRLKDAGFQFAFPAIRCKFKPTEATLQQCEESGTDLAQVIKRNVLKKERMAAQKLSVAESASNSALAVGRVVGSLCVLTARDGDAESAMLASWISQASFDPPGLTVAVKRDRAVESFLPIGNRFVLNVLGEGKEKAIMKAMLKPFAPGEDRFADVQVDRSEWAGGAAIFPEAASYLECSVSQRMEAGDHWVVYATVEDGKVLDENVQSAVHFRKVGTSY